jgi:hypothetical protein
MPAIIVSHATGATPESGKIYSVPLALTDDNARFVLLPPTGICPIKQRPSFAQITFDSKSRLLICGGFSDNLMVDEELRSVRQGITAPDVQPAITPSGTGITGSCIGYYSFWDDIAKRRSPLSVGSDVDNLSNQGRQWTNIPTVPPDELFVEGARTHVNAATTITITSGDIDEIWVGDRVALDSAPTTFATVIAVDYAADTFTVNAALGNGSADQAILVHRHVCITHVELWVSMNGETPRKSGMVDLGVASLTENTATLALGEAAPDEYTRFPPCRFNFVWQQRQWMCGDPVYPNRIYYSPINIPDQMEGWLETLYGDAAIALFGNRDMLFVGSSERVYHVDAFTAGDFALRVAEPGLGVLNHFANVAVRGNIIVPSRRGIYVCTGGTFVFVASDYQNEWRAFQDTDGFWAHDHRDDGTVRIYLGSLAGAVDYTRFGLSAVLDDEAPATATAYLVLDYGNFDQLTNRGIEIFIDYRARLDTSAFYVPVAGASNRGLWVCSDDGGIRIDQAVGAGDTDDDGDDFGREAIVAGRHTFDMNFGGSDADGRIWQNVWMFVESEENAWTLSLWAGDEKAYQGDAPWSADVLASLKTATRTDENGTRFDYLYVPKTVHFFVPQIPGRGMTFLIVVPEPAHSFAFRGWGAKHTPGPVGRGMTTTVTVLG